MRKLAVPVAVVALGGCGGESKPLGKAKPEPTTIYYSTSCGDGTDHPCERPAPAVEGVGVYSYPGSSTTPKRIKRKP